MSIYVIKYESLDGLICGHAGVKRGTTDFFTKSHAKKWIDKNRKKGFVYMIIETY